MTVVKLIARVRLQGLTMKPLPAWNDDALMMLSSRTIAMINTKNMSYGPVVGCKANDHSEWAFGIHYSSNGSKKRLLSSR